MKKDLSIMTKRTSNKTSLRTLTPRQLAATCGGGASLVGVDFELLDLGSTDEVKAVLNGIGGSGLVIPGLEY